jgi:hypothetical protein
MIKIPRKLGMEGKFLNLLKDIYKKKKKPVVNIILNVKKLEVAP